MHQIPSLRRPAGSVLLIVFIILLSGCGGKTTGGPSTPVASPGVTQAGSAPASLPTATPTAGVPVAGSQATPTACSGGVCVNVFSPAGAGTGAIPKFSHVVWIVLENHGYSQVIGNTEEMPNFNKFAQQYTLLTQYYAVTHPSLPNYIAMIGGDTFGIHTDCSNCYVPNPSLPDLLEGSGHSWKTYQENMPSPCYAGSSGDYTKTHDPFVYFDPIRTDAGRCQQHVVPFDQLDKDLLAGKLPDFAFITPNLCDNAHNCSLSQADSWLGDTLGKIQKALFLDKTSLIVVTFDEGDGNASCCGLGSEAGGHVATILISPLVKTGYQDDTPYSHYSVLKTIADSWGLTELGHAGDQATNPIVKPWKNQP